MACAVQANTATSASSSHFTGGSKSQSGGVDSKSKNHKKDRPTCTHCGILGHTKDNFYRVIGFPPHYKKSKSVATVNVVTTGTEDSPSANSSMSFTAQQCQVCLQMLQTQLSQAQLPDSAPNGNSDGSNQAD